MALANVVMVLFNGCQTWFHSGKMVTQSDFPAVIKSIATAADAELGAGAGVPAARANEASRKLP